MSILLGGVDPIQAIVDLELQVVTLNMLVEQLSQQVGKTITPEQFLQARNEAFKLVQKKYPQLGLELKNG